MLLFKVDRPDDQSEITFYENDNSTILGQIQHLRFTQLIGIVLVIFALIVADIMKRCVRFIVVA